MCVNGFRFVLSPQVSKLVIYSPAKTVPIFEAKSRFRYTLGNKIDDLRIIKVYYGENWK